MTTTQRIHGMDALRGIMMMLGLVLHSAESYSVGTDLLWPKDPFSSHLFFTYLTSIIHIFRMPTFFMISGFFSAMMFYDRSPYAMINQRFKRVLFPFLVFLMLLHPIIFHSYKWMIEAFNATSFVDQTFRLLPSITYHLWFLYYLLIITGFTYLLALVLKRMPRITYALTKLFTLGMRHQLLFLLVLSFTLFVLLIWMWDYWVPTPLTFMPDVKVLLFYEIFFLFGWLMYVRKNLLPMLKRFDRLFVLLAFLLYTIKFIFHEHIHDVVYGGLNTMIGWFFVIGFTGLFLRYFNTESKVGRYLSDASYWVYLVHLPFTILVPTLIVGFQLSVAAKFGIVLFISTVTCFLSYHYMVRSSFIGKFLNGRRY